MVAHDHLGFSVVSGVCRAVYAHDSNLVIEPGDCLVAIGERKSLERLATLAARA